jgi:RND family efflux transporter MFP subunit
MSKKLVLLSLILLPLLLILLLACGDGAAENESSDTEGTVEKDSSSTESKEGDNEGKTDKSGKDKDDKKMELVPVEITTVEKGTISDYILLSANLETEKMADVYSRVQGLVEQIYVDEGDFVKKGQVLMALEADEYMLAEEKTRLSYEKQKSDFQRLEAMYKQNLLSIEEFEQAKFTMKGLEVDWKQSKLNLSYTRITAPISGVIGDRLRKPGDRIQPADKLFTVINTQEMITVVYAPEKELGLVKKNQTAYVTSDHLPGEQYEGWIKRVSPVVDPQSGTFKITVGVQNLNNKLRAGMFVNTHIITATHTDAVLIPKRAIVYENEGMNVFIVRDSVATKVILKVGFQDHEKVESLEGIQQGDKIIIVGQAGLKDGTRVRVVNVKENDIAFNRREQTQRL